MITRDMSDTGYCAAGGGNPPPLHVRDTQSAGANWYPLPRPLMFPHPPGAVLVTIPHLPPDQFGEDPTDPGRQHRPRIATAGLNARLNVRPGQHNVGARGERH